MQLRRQLDALPPWVVGALASLLALLVYLPTATWNHHHVNDVRATTLAAWSIAERGTVDVPEEALTGIPWVREVDGQHRIHRTPGPILWAALFYLPGKYPSSVDGIDDVPFGPSTGSAVLAAAFGIGAMAVALRRLVAGHVAFGSAVVLALGTGNWSVAADGAWTHALTLLFLSLGLLAMSSDRFAAGGLSMAAAIFTRPQTAVAPLVMGLWSGVRRRSLRPVLVVAATSALGVVGLLLWYVPLFGEWLPRSSYVTSIATGAAVGGGTSPSHAALAWLGSLGLWLVSPSRGLFLFSPFLLVLVPAVRGGWRHAPEWVRSATVAGLVYVLVQSRGNVWHGGGNYFGYRLPLEALTLTWPLLTISFDRVVRHHPRWRTTVIQLSLAAILVFAVGATFLRPDPIAQFETTAESGAASLGYQ